MSWRPENVTVIIFFFFQQELILTNRMIIDFNGVGSSLLEDKLGGIQS